MSYNSQTMIQWNIGILECWNIGILEYWNIGMLECWNIGMLDKEATDSRIKDKCTNKKRQELLRLDRRSKLTRR